MLTNKYQPNDVTCLHQSASGDWQNKDLGIEHSTHRMLAFETIFCCWRFINPKKPKRRQVTHRLYTVFDPGYPNLPRSSLLSQFCNFEKCLLNVSVKYTYGRQRRFLEVSGSTVSHVTCHNIQYMSCFYQF